MFEFGEQSPLLKEDLLSSFQKLIKPLTLYDKSLNAQLL